MAGPRVICCYSPIRFFKKLSLEVLREMPVIFRTALLLTASNVFMTFAWYAHLKNLYDKPWYIAAFASWGIALLEYLFQVPANRMGHGVYSAAELKTMQEVITLVVFAGFSVWVLGEALTWKHAVGFTLIALGAGVIFYK